MAADTAHLFPGKVFISTALELLETKAHMSGRLAARYLQRAVMAGVLIGVFYVTNYAVIAAFDAVQVDDTTLGTLGRVAGALTFGWALVFIYYTKSELLTSNMMIVAVGAYHRRSSWATSMRILGLCFGGNMLGGAFLAVLLRFSTLTDGAVGEQMSGAVEHKLAYLETAAGWGDLFVRAILCNLMINLAMLLVYNGLIKEDITRTFAMIMAVFVFAFLGLEHSVANTVLFAVVGLREGIDVGLAAGNVALALLGNFVGGGVLIGLYYAYVNDDAGYLRRRGHERSPQAPEPPLP